MSVRYSIIVTFSDVKHLLLYANTEIEIENSAASLYFLHLLFLLEISISPEMTLKLLIYPSASKQFRSQNLLYSVFVCLCFHVCFISTPIAMK